MKISGFTFIKNALIYDYPIVEAINSILPLCDEFVVAVGKSEDDTLNLINSIDSNKIKIIETEWNEKLREGGRVLAVETDKAFAQISKESNWAFYIQGDEVVHEKYLQSIYDNMVKYRDEKYLDGLLFKYLHFYGSYNYIGNSSNWYTHEIRIIKNDKTIYSYRDAQGFRKGQDKKLKVKMIDAEIYHYGWVKNPKIMLKKQKNFNKYWHDDEWIEKQFKDFEEYLYSNDICLIPFNGTHPKVMQERINIKNWNYIYRQPKKRYGLKNSIKKAMFKCFGLNFNYSNYELV
ncbi:MAG: glycosyltransferase family 2 protein [Bacteroidia bacterium]|nr:glycosyltransferase family 2 protein [Bacteroidia bacterium]